MRNSKINSIGTVPVIEKPLWWQLRGLMYTATGYGKKIPTSRMARINGRLHRIYCHIFSNCRTCYVIINGDHVIVD